MATVGQVVSVPRHRAARIRGPVRAGSCLARASVPARS